MKRTYQPSNVNTQTTQAFARMSTKAEEKW